MKDDPADPQTDRTLTGDLDAALPGSSRQADHGEATAETARTAGLEPGDAAPAGEQDRAITGELDRAVNAPDHSVTRDREEAALPVRGRS